MSQQEAMGGHCGDCQALWVRADQELRNGFTIVIFAAKKAELMNRE